MRYEPAYHPVTRLLDVSRAPDHEHRTRTVGLDRVRAGFSDVVADPERLAALRRLASIDQSVDRIFHTILGRVRRRFGVALARIHLLDDTRQWVHAGSDESAGSSIPVERSACQYVLRQDRVLVIPDLTGHDGIEDVVANAQRMRFYAAAPLLTAEGHAVGALCLMDPTPRADLTPTEVEVLLIMADLAGQALELSDCQSDAQRDLLRAFDADPVTGLLSRAGLLMRLQHLLDTAASDERVTGLLAFRLRRIDRVLCASGYRAMDGLRRAIGERLSATLSDHDLIAHPDDNTFLVVSSFPATPGSTPDTWLAARAGDLIASLRAEAFDVDGDVFQPEVGVGVARAPADGVEAHELVALVDEAAERASLCHINRIAWPDHDAMTAARRRLSLETRLRRAANDAFTVHYQPIVDLHADDAVVGAEALLRWPQGEGYPAIGPEVFIPLAERLGLMERLGTHVFDASCRQLRCWQDQRGGAGFWVSVNLAPTQLQAPGLAARFAEIAAAHGVSPGSVRLEVTESAFADTFDASGQVINELVAAGFVLALDDFGTGHSSLSRLINMPFQLLKVDRSFVREIPDGTGAAVVESLAHLARSLGLAALGEGVETAEQAAYLRRCGYDYAQGYLYGKPVPAEGFPIG
jgi:EAL domain-containing protein (putative c-di-GMP-specific phosphodiesterase class I)/GGDEF domain-containing protein